MYLEQRAAEDELFAKNYRNPVKNMDDCVTYILNYVQKSGCNGFSDGEIYGQAVHYYDENEIEVGNPLQCHVAVNHVVELTAEEKAEARQNALRQYQNEELRRLQSRNKPTTTAKKETNVQPTLFDF
ncbi:pcfK-like family protein [Bacteroides fragilis str. S23 R14]|nr:pcfK-like family protein [Bacteroides fragilis str. S23 R14]